VPLLAAPRPRVDSPQGLRHIEDLLVPVRQHELGPMCRGERGSPATSPMVPLAVRCRIRGQERPGERPVRTTTPGRRGNQRARRVMSEQLRTHTRPSRAFRKMDGTIGTIAGDRAIRPSLADLHSGTRPPERGARGARPGPHVPKSPLQPQGGLTPPLPRADPAPGLEGRSPGHFADSGSRSRLVDSLDVRARISIWACTP
jgi:hypothetical protein